MSLEYKLQHEKPQLYQSVWYARVGHFCVYLQFHSTDVFWSQRQRQTIPATKSVILWVCMHLWWIWSWRSKDIYMCICWIICVVRVLCKKTNSKGWRTVMMTYSMEAILLLACIHSSRLCTSMMMHSPCGIALVLVKVPRCAGWTLDTLISGSQSVGRLTVLVPTIMS